MCNLRATIGSDAIQGPTSEHDLTQWTQCHAPAFGQSVDTSRYPSGALPLGIQAENAAGVWASASKSLAVDNQPPTLSLSGPTDAPDTAGVQHVIATAAAGPSGVSGIACSLDSAPWQWYAQSSAPVPVSGDGVHQVTCYAANNAKDAAGHVGSSAPSTWKLSIRQPSVVGAYFTRVADPLRCTRHSERRWIPAHWTKTLVQGRLVRVRRPGHFSKSSVVTRCHPHLVPKLVGSKGKAHVVWTPVFPKVVQQSQRLVAFHAPTTVGGWLGTNRGTALAGQTVRVLTAPDNGLEQFSQVAVAISRSDGTWVASLPPGPSSLVEAVYDGSASTEPAASAYARVIVPSRVLLGSSRAASGGAERSISPGGSSAATYPGCASNFYACGSGRTGSRRPSGSRTSVPTAASRRRSRSTRGKGSSTTGSPYRPSMRPTTRTRLEARPASVSSSAPAIGRGEVKRT